MTYLVEVRTAYGWVPFHVFASVTIQQVLSMGPPEGFTPDDWRVRRIRNIQRSHYEAEIQQIWRS